MFKLIILVLGLGIGFGGGVMWSSHHPDQAARVSARETEQLQATLTNLQQVAGRHLPANTTGSASADASSAPADPDYQQLSQKAQKELDVLKAKLGN